MESKQNKKIINIKAKLLFATLLCVQIQCNTLTAKIFSPFLKQTEDSQKTRHADHESENNPVTLYSYIEEKPVDRHSVEPVNYQEKLRKKYQEKLNSYKKNSKKETLSSFLKKGKNTERSVDIKNKKWNFIVYIAGNNNLHKYIIHNLCQMTQVGSNENISIFAQIDQVGKENIQRVKVEKDQIVVLEELKKNTQTASGTKDSLYSCFEWVLKKSPAEHNALILWNHGSGIMDPHRWGRTVSLLDETGTEITDKLMGIAFNDTFCEYLTNTDLSETLDKIQKNLLHGKKIDLIGMDACNMAMLEVASQIKTHANYMVASQEVELGPGWNYERVLEIFKRTSPQPAELASHIVSSYEKEYLPYTHDYTQSAIDLKSLNSLEENVHTISGVLYKLLSGPSKDLVKKTLRSIRASSQTSTWFYDNNYIDLHHFYLSLMAKVKRELFSHLETKDYNNLIAALTRGTQLIRQTVINNCSGAYLPEASGVSIYFPHRNIHSSYEKTNFAQNNNWFSLLKQYSSYQRLL